MALSSSTQTPECLLRLLPASLLLAVVDGRELAKVQFLHRFVYVAFQYERYIRFMRRNCTPKLLEYYEQRFKRAETKKASSFFFFQTAKNGKPPEEAHERRDMHKVVNA